MMAKAKKEIKRSRTGMGNAADVENKETKRKEKRRIAGRTIVKDVLSESESSAESEDLSRVELMLRLKKNPPA
ncbi:MAG: uncharacterized protein KVP18_000881 [Porospora cf. gigantea A]|uniref:uncharacterized protein n=1 Tax=Porospora cf. gigantea A TaxID=2853593 RepID=UPI00355948A9|nr:MAG: hypothetical protein KVP18_000881 [Porospora cf. gigantea A]